MLLIRSLKSTVLAFTAVLALGASGAAAATSEIEGVWSFAGGSVIIQPITPGSNTFQGTVQTETKFAECAHTVGEVMWTNMAEQPDGSFWGLHQWFRAECKLESSFVGPTAWRVLHTAAGGRYLKVCFSHPGGPQPTIAVSGAPNNQSEYAAYDVTYGCYESALIEPVPTVEGEGTGKGDSNSGAITFVNTVVLPPTAVCVSQRTLKIKLKDPKKDPFEEVLVKIGSKRVADLKGVKAIAKALKNGITLKKLPSGTYKVSVVATTILKQHLTGAKTYKSCIKGSSARSSSKAAKNTTDGGSVG